jgi:hypothetical protein
MRIGNLGALIGAGRYGKPRRKTGISVARPGGTEKNPLTCDEYVTPVEEQMRFL